MNAVYGNCAACGFPVLVTKVSSQVDCPFCHSVNQYVGGALPGVVIGLFALVGLVIFIKSKA